MHTLGTLLHGYKYEVTFTKRFVDGPMVNRTYPERVRFATWQAADEYRQWCESGKVVKPCAGGSSYKCEDAALSAI